MQGSVFHACTYVDFNAPWPWCATDTDLIGMLKNDQTKSDILQG